MAYLEKLRIFTKAFRSIFQIAQVSCNLMLMANLSGTSSHRKFLVNDRNKIKS
jgi:hypothetical protein